MTRKLNILLAVCLFLASGYQVLFHPDETNLECVMIVIGACVLIGYLVSRERNYLERPLPTFTTMWFPFASLFVPLVGTTLDGNPLIYELKLPVQAFGYTALVAVIVGFTHILFCRLEILHYPQTFIQRSVLPRLGVFKIPSILQLWVFGAVGSVASVILLVFLQKAEESGVGFLPQILQTLRPFGYAPFIMPFMPLIGSTVKPTKLQYLLLAPYALVTIGVAMLANSRSVFAVPLLTLVLAGLFMLMTGYVSARIISWPRILGTLFIAGIGATVLTDVSSAMRVARLDRGSVSAVDLAGETLKVFFDKNRLRNYWASTRAMSGEAGSWDEDYLHNEFLQRISSLKFIDLSLYFTQDFGEAERQRLRSFANDRLISSLPNPVIEFLGLPVKKQMVLNMSYGDFLYGARSTSYGAFRTGSFVVVDGVIHRQWFYPVLILNTLLYFFVTNCFTRREKVGSNGGGMKQTVRVVFAPIALIFAYPFVQALYQESLATTLMFYLRGLSQMIILYLLLFRGTQIFNLLAPRFGEQRVSPRRPVSVGVR